MTKDALSSLAVNAFAQMDARKTEASKTLTDHQVAQKAEYAKTARLRALRLAKEEAEREAKLAEPVAAPKKAVKSKAKAKPKAEPPKARRSISWGR